MRATGTVHRHRSSRQACLKIVTIILHITVTLIFSLKSGVWMTSRGAMQLLQNDRSDRNKDSMFGWYCMRPNATSFGRFFDTDLSDAYLQLSCVRDLSVGQPSTPSTRVAARSLSRNLLHQAHASLISDNNSVHAGFPSHPSLHRPCTPSPPPGSLSRGTPCGRAPSPQQAFGGTSFTGFNMVRS